MRYKAGALALCALVLASGCSTSSDVAVAPPTEDAPGDMFVDPQGTYTITNGDGWDELPSSVVKEIESWSVGANGNSIGVLEYSGPMAGQSLHFLAVFDVRNERAVVATFTAREDSFQDLRSTSGPFLQTLRAT